VKTVRSHDPARWRARDVDATTLEARAAALTDAARQVSPLGAQAVSRIRAEVLEQAADRGRVIDFRRRPMVARVAVGLALLLMGAATADGAGILWRRHLQSARTAAPTPPPGATPPRAPRTIHRAAASNDQRPPDPALDPGSAPVPPLASDPVGQLGQLGTHQPMRHAGAGVRANAAPAPASAPVTPEPAPPRAQVPEAPPTKATEAGMVAEALSQLRQQGDPRAALVTLDAYGRAFPHGVLETEAVRTRLEAVIRLDDRKAALALLDAMPGLSDEPGTDLLLTRAELRAAAGRFREALADFSQVVEGEGGAPAASERALYGRAVCLGRLAEEDRARADLLAYERRFPSGRFATEVRRLLSEPAPAAARP
jgi:hypothetical protein